MFFSYHLNESKGVKMRTKEEIIKRIEERRSVDFFSFEWPYYLNLLTYEEAKPFLDPDCDGKDWEVKTLDEIKQDAIEYMPFAWEKANNCRGISAWRSISHYIAWLWLLGEDFDDIGDYEFYGKPQLIRICEYLGLDHTEWDDDIRVNTG